MGETKDAIERFLDAIWGKGHRVVLPEGAEPRILKAARELIDRNLARPVLLGPEETIHAAAAEAGVWTDGFTIIDPETADKRDAYAEAYTAGQRKPNIKIAQRLMRKPVYFGAMMVRQGDAAAIVAGAASPTRRVIEAGLMTVGLAEGIETPSSFFLMLLDDFQGTGPRALIYADCAVNVEPDANQLADIAIASARTAGKLLDEPTAVALLSFSTQGSAQHSRVTKVREAVAIARERAPELTIDGEFQADSALIKGVAETKARQASDVAGRANVLIFPDLDAGNIAYKLTQYLAGAQAIGPVLQGFNRPVADLSRGASVEDIIATTAMALVMG